MKNLLLLAYLMFFFIGYSQSNSYEIDGFKPNPEKEAKFLPYLAVRHGGIANIGEWKKNNRIQYFKELWYFCESFYVKRDFSEAGIVMDESMIDITRLESQRKENEEAIVIFPGFKDVIVLLPVSQLKYKPQF